MITLEDFEHDGIKLAYNWHQFSFSDFEKVVYG